MNPLRWSRCWSRTGLSAVASRPTSHTHAHLRLVSRLSGPQLAFAAYSPSLGDGLRTRYRQYQHLAPQPPKPAPETAAKPAVKAPPKPSSNPEDAVHISLAEQRRKDWNIVKRLSGNLWPKNDWSTRSRVLLGVGLLVCGKVRLRPSSDQVTS